MQPITQNVQTCFSSMREPSAGCTCAFTLQSNVCCAVNTLRHGGCPSAENGGVLKHSWCLGVCESPTTITKIDDTVQGQILRERKPLICKQNSSVCLFKLFSADMEQARDVETGSMWRLATMCQKYNKKTTSYPVSTHYKVPFICLI